ncbi:unnamed protein product [Auanema sp. JU1783]|nr:unnamed protein product [Auanema sp. JU1783]
MSSDESDDDYQQKPSINEDSGSDDSDGSNSEGEKKPATKKPVKRKLESDSEEDEEEEEKEEESELDSEEEEEIKQTAKKKKRGRKSRQPKGTDFIIRDVYVDDDAEEDDDYVDDDDRGFEPNEREEAERYMKQIEAERRSERNLFANMNEDEIGRYFENKYKSAPSRDMVDDDGGLDDISQHSLLPSTKDPNLWIVKCRMGEEKLVAMQLMRKYIAYETSDEPLQIKSIVVKEGLKGMIYIEAYKQSHVASAIDGISALNSYNIAMVPIKDMVDTLRVVKDTPTLKSGSYVRLKRTMYKDDLAQVDLVDIASNKVNLKIVPRIDYSRMRGALRTDADRNAKIKKRAPCRLFDLERIKEIGGEVTNDGDFHIFEGGHYRRGFLYKSFPMNAIIAEGVKPTLAELEVFQEKNQDLKKELEATTVKDMGHNFAPGDMVEVTEGELVNLRGKVESVEGDKIVILPEHEDLKEALTLNSYELKKFFKTGDHVKVIGGRYEGDTGMIVRVETNMVVVISDLGVDEMKVRPRDVQLCADVTTGVDSLGQYQYHDLVMLDQQTAGVITRLEKEHVEILTIHGKVIRVKPQSIQCKKDSRNIKALDSQQNTIEVRDMVKIIDGPHAAKKDKEEEKQGEIKHLYRSFAFIYSRRHTENGGIFVCKPRHLLLVGSKPKASEIPAMNRLMATPNPFMSPRRTDTSSVFGGMTPAQSVSGRSMRGGQTPGSTATGAMGPPLNNPTRARRDNSLIGKSVRITQGPLKGYFGIVKDATEQTVRVELHTQCKTISVDRSRILLVGDGTPGGSVTNVYSRTPAAFDDGRTPMYSSKTPMYGAQTPMYGAQTPMHDSARTPHYGGMTPGYDGGRTPAYDGGRTPAHDGGRTPAYDGGRTPAYDGGRTPAYDGGRTPAYDGGRTPAYEPAATPGRDNDKRSDDEEDSGPHYDAPGSPTYSVPTPGALLNPQTPGYAPETPLGNYNPLTPGGMYGDYSAPSPYVRNDSNDHITPGEIPIHFLENGEWVMENLFVTIKNNHDDTRYHDREGMVKKVQNGRCQVLLTDYDDLVDADFDQILPVRPKVDDYTRVIYGDETGFMGQLLSCDDEEGLIKGANDKMKMAPVSLCCKMEG